MEVSSKLKIAITGTTSGIGRATVNLLSTSHSITRLNRPEYDLLDDDVLDYIDLSGHDVLINNAGADYNRTDFINHEYKYWKNTIKINYIVPMYLTQKFIQQNSKGIVVNITSAGNMRLPTTNSTVFYRSSKQAIKHFTNEINETHSDFRIVDIEPSKTDTNFTKNAGQGVDYKNVSMSSFDVAEAIKTAIYTPTITHIKIKNSV